MKDCNRLKNPTNPNMFPLIIQRDTIKMPTSREKLTLMNRDSQRRDLVGQTMNDLSDCN